ncbi:MAG: NADH-quinone oxidoreductase subunit NuoE [Acidimicrobiales bacterium]|nr:NADH-quinone oxidoreductase subunit NuoE [Acidimicrobiales bacterium]MYG89291.1 NADH-quinone oxidoreductase subunit NuoE [Acidimicrobiales bacterium]MYI29122.1 NADH-quinone oxidoreductase subunit NuoE [Acidimicrobiales bacterium]
MSFFSEENRTLAHEIIGRYPKRRSAMIPLLHVAQAQAGWVTEEAMVEIAELVDTTPAEVLGTCSFYEMFKREPVGKFLVNICATMSCALAGAAELMEHAEERLGVRAGGTTPDGLFTLASAECQAACTEAPCLQVNYRYRYRVDADGFDQLVDDLAAGALDDEIPPHGVTARVRQRIPAGRAVGAVPPEAVAEEPVWLAIADGVSSGGAS